MLKCSLLLFVLVAVASGRRAHYRSDAWDVILFTQNWPVTECLQMKHDNPDGKCNKADFSQWTIHGMWPTKLGTKGPGFCDDELKFEISEIESIVEEMAFRWLSIKTGHGADKDFWKHEWEKHGTCAVVLQTLDSELKYFTQGLNWNSKYNMSSMLEKTGLKPGGSPLTIDSIYSRLQSITATNPFISCYKQKDSGKTFLIDIRLCFDKSLKLVDCDGVMRRDDEHPLTQDCPSGTPIYYPDANQLFEYNNNQPDNYIPDGYRPDDSPDNYRPDDYTPDNYIPDDYVPDNYIPDDYVPEKYLKN